MKIADHLFRLWLWTLFTLMISCGSDIPSDQPAPEPEPTAEGQAQPDPGNSEKLPYAKMQTNLVNYCQACHANDGFMKSEAQLRSSAAKVRLANKSMPPSFAPKKLPDNIRTEMLKYF